MLLNQSRYCDFSRSGDGTNGYQNDEPFACRIRNASFRDGTHTADSLLKSEISITDPADFPVNRNPADKLRSDLNSAERLYRKLLRSVRGSAVPINGHLIDQWDDSRDAYRVARANLRTWLRAEHASETYGVFFSCDGTEVRSENPGAGLDFDSYVDAVKCAREQQQKSICSIKYYVRELP